MPQHPDTYLTTQNVLRFFVLLSLILALLTGLGWEKLRSLEKKYADLQRRHERLNKIYLQEKK
jgi:hypothetical protein